MAKAVRVAVVETLALSKQALIAGEDLLLSGFGKFCLNDKKPRRAEIRRQAVRCY